MPYQHLSGPDFLAALAETELNLGNDANAIEFRRRHRDWTLDKDALRRARDLNAALEAEVLDLRRRNTRSVSVSAPIVDDVDAVLAANHPGAINYGGTDPLPEMDERHYAPGAIVIVSHERSWLRRTLDFLMGGGGVARDGGPEGPLPKDNK